MVSLWRVLLWGRYLFVAAGLSFWSTLVVALLPLSLIVVVLTSLNLERVAFNIMDGVRPEDATVNDAAYVALVGITLIAVLAFLPLLALYVAKVASVARSRSESRKQVTETR